MIWLAIAIGALALALMAWHLVYLIGGRARRDLEIGERLRRYGGR